MQYEYKNRNKTQSGPSNQVQGYGTMNNNTLTRSSLQKTTLNLNLNVLTIK